MGNRMYKIIAALIALGFIGMGFSAGIGGGSDTDVRIQNIVGTEIDNEGGEIMVQLTSQNPEPEEVNLILKIDGDIIDSQTIYVEDEKNINLNFSIPVSGDDVLSVVVEDKEGIQVDMAGGPIRSIY